MLSKTFKFFTTITTSINRNISSNKRFYSISNRDRVEETMKYVDRNLFLPERYKGFDSSVDIGYNTTISSTKVHKLSLELMQSKLKPNENIIALDIGIGSGYITACMSHMIGNYGGGSVFGIDHVDGLLKKAKDRFLDLKLNDKILLDCSDGRTIYERIDKDLRFDVIYCGGSIKSELIRRDSKLLDLLKVGGIMIASVGNNAFDQQLFKIEKVGDKHYIYHFVSNDYAFMPLTDLDYQLSREYNYDPFFL